jgi:hypothetical protein
VRPQLVTEAEVRKLHEKLEWARQTFRPKEGFLLDTPCEKLPETHPRRYRSFTTRANNNTK